MTGDGDLSESLFTCCFLFSLTFKLRVLRRELGLFICLCIMYLAYQSKKKKRTFILVQQQQGQPHVARSCTSATRSGLHNLPALILTQNAEDLRWIQPLRG